MYVCIYIYIYHAFAVPGAALDFQLVHLVDQQVYPSLCLSLYF